MKHLAKRIISVVASHIAGELFDSVTRGKTTKIGFKKVRAKAKASKPFIRRIK